MTNNEALMSYLVARLKKGVTEGQAQSDVNVIAGASSNSTRTQTQTKESHHRHYSLRESSLR